MTWVGDARDRLAGIGILLAQPIGIAERHRRAHLGAKPVTVMDRGRHDRALAPRGAPPQPVVDGHSSATTAPLPEDEPLACAKVSYRRRNGALIRFTHRSQGRRWLWNGDGVGWPKLVRCFRHRLEGIGADEREEREPL